MVHGIPTSEAAVQGVPALTASTLCEAPRVTAATHSEGAAQSTPGGSVASPFAHYADPLRPKCGDRP